MELAIKGKKAKLKVPEAAFGRPFSEALVHQVVTAYLAGGRAGTKATKSRSDAHGGGRKPYRQKGTGRARAGTIRSPLWRGGGHSFALRPRDHRHKVNRKMYRGALRSIFSELLRLDRLEIVERFELEQPKTALLVEKLKDYDGARVLIITEEVGPNLYLAARNLTAVNVIDSTAVDPVTLIATDRVIATVDAVKKISEWLG